MALTFAVTLDDGGHITFSTTLILHLSLLYLKLFRLNVNEEWQVHNTTTFSFKAYIVIPYHITQILLNSTMVILITTNGNST